MLAPLSLAAAPLALPSHDPKLSPTAVYYREQHTVQIIELVECSAPPPRNIASVINDSAYSSSYSSDYSSEGSDEDSEDSEDEEAATSYCSSDLPPEHPDAPSAGDDVSPRIELASECYSSIKRILAWRENFSNDFSAAFETSSPPSLKRKMALDDDDDSTSHTSKRSRRSQASQGNASIISLDTHPCPACDASFATRQDLRQHGRHAQANEACSAAVEYAFE